MADTITIDQEGNIGIDIQCPFCERILLISYTDSSDFGYYRLYCLEHGTIRYGRSLEDIIKSYTVLVDEEIQE